jgi:hypothetical protein
MQRGMIVLLAATILVGSKPIVAAELPREQSRVASNDYERVQSRSRTPRNAPYDRLRVQPPYPVACEAVIFPRSRLCAGRPANYGPYVFFPFSWFWYD